MPFSTFLRLQGDHHCACARKWCHFSFFPRAFKQKKIKALRPKMTKIASRGSCLKFRGTLPNVFARLMLPVVVAQPYYSFTSAVNVFQQAPPLQRKKMVIGWKAWELHKALMYSDFTRAVLTCVQEDTGGLGSFPGKIFNWRWPKIHFFKDWHQNFTQKIVQSVQLASKPTTLRPWTQKTFGRKNTAVCCRASERKLSTIFIALVTKKLPTVS